MATLAKPKHLRIQNAKSQVSSPTLSQIQCIFVNLISPSTNRERFQARKQGFAVGKRHTKTQKSGQKCWIVFQLRGKFKSFQCFQSFPGASLKLTRLVARLHKPRIRLHVSHSLAYFLNLILVIYEWLITFKHSIILVSSFGMFWFT